MKTLQKNKLFRLALLAGVCTASCFAGGDPTVLVQDIYAAVIQIVGAGAAIVIIVQLSKVGFQGARAIGGLVAAGFCVWGIMNAQSIVTYFQGKG